MSDQTEEPCSRNGTTERRHQGQSVSVGSNAGRGTLCDPLSRIDDPGNGSLNDRTDNTDNTNEPKSVEVAIVFDCVATGDPTVIPDFEERAAIVEFDGGEPRVRAEQLAAREMGLPPKPANAMQLLRVLFSKLEARFRCVRVDGEAWPLAALPILYTPTAAAAAAVPHCEPDIGDDRTTRPRGDT